MKKILSLLLALCLITSCFTACAAKGENNSKSSSEASADSPTDTSSGEAENEENTFKSASVTELISTGEIPYEKFKCITTYNRFNGYEYNLDQTDNLFKFIHDFKYGYADEYGNVKIKEQYESASDFSEGKAFVKADDCWKIIDTSGKVLFNIPKDLSNIYYFNYPKFCNGKAIVEKISVSEEGSQIKVLVIDNNFKINELNLGKATSMDNCCIPINTPEFQGAQTFVYNYSAKKYTWRLFDLSGKEIWNTSTSASPYKISKDIIAKNGYMNITDENGKWGLLDLKTGKTIIDCQYDYLGAYSDGVIPVCSYDKWGYIDINGNETVKPSFNSVSEMNNGKALAISTDNKLCVINKNGEIENEVNIDLGKGTTLYPFSSETGLALVITDTQFYEHFFSVVATDGTIATQIRDNKFYITNSFIFFNNRMFKIEK